jgi:hypothetical protein
MKDLYNSIVLKRGLSPVSVADNTAQTTQIIDTQGYEGVLFSELLGSLADADATFAFTVAESVNSNMSSPSAVPAANMVGTLAESSFQFDDDNEVRKLLVYPTKRYVQATITPSGNASAAVLAVGVQLIGGKYLPVTQPTA